MMTNTTHPSDAEAPPPVDTSKYDAEQQHLDDADIHATANIFNLVGSELTMVDKQSIDSSNKKATRLDEKKVFNRPHMTQPTAPQPVQHQPVHTPLIPQPATPPIPQQTQVVHQQAVPAMISVDNSEILSKIDEMGKKVDDLYNVYEKLLEKISKSTKRMTLTINDKD